jgi:hypothetical protein
MNRPLCRCTAPGASVHASRAMQIGLLCGGTVPAAISRQDRADRRVRAPPPRTAVTPSHRAGRHRAARHGRRWADPAGRRHSRPAAARAGTLPRVEPRCAGATGDHPFMTVIPAAPRAITRSSRRGGGCLLRDDTLRVIRLRRESHQGDLQVAIPVCLGSGVIPGRPGSVTSDAGFSYTDFGAVVDSAIWGNGSCQSSAWTPPSEGGSRFAVRTSGHHLKVPGRCIAPPRSRPARHRGRHPALRPPPAPQSDPRTAGLRPARPEPGPGDTPRYRPTVPQGRAARCGGHPACPAPR